MKGNRFVFSLFFHFFYLLDPSAHNQAGNDTIYICWTRLLLTADRFSFENQPYFTIAISMGKPEQSCHDKSSPQGIEIDPIFPTLKSDVLRLSSSSEHLIPGIGRLSIGAPSHPGACSSERIRECLGTTGEHTEL
ncbi:uncharacterized protein F4822DRAFT_313402 [Hypoxylon trugodes]|uniref:uncharacterized protein n=1 Tax=Hypoxylon trugodes TaxID=326681 RepID=UPI00219E4841|nr:uncharacterized protein F4822DRAFT_313402 [Hypoxylon trugodes]KAI1386355.1 hypothetical protein F4822DRAFT_313402 [Hypoxylon trugodes]